ncbi:voltage-gated potassium channel [Xylaria intraflava]|nr:voltage-gated potassium channel [Xylaria intraflava]
MEVTDPSGDVAEPANAADHVSGDGEQPGTVEPVRAAEVHFDPTRWWFASAAFPMIAGTLGPMASAFSICALVEPWRQHVAPGSDIKQATIIADPSWLLAVNAVQLVIAVIANFSLLLNMAKRVRFSVAQPITIVGWYTSSILLVALCATASGPLIQQPKTEFIWSQAFYYGLFAAILYFLVASLMVVTVWGAQAGHYPKHFKLTLGQRTLMLQTILFLTYLLLGALIFSHIEGWLYLDAVYWADVTLFTVGFGDLALKTSLGRGLMIPYALIGITTLGLVIGSIRSLALDKGKSMLDARMLEKKRRRFVKSIMKSSEGQALQPITEKNADYYPHPRSLDSPREFPRAELERRQNEFYLMRKIQDQASKRRRWMAMTFSTGSWAVLWLVGAKVFQVCEAPYQDWSYFDSIYFSFQAMTTIGYGDITPLSNAAKAFFVFWSLLALPTLTILISHAGNTIVKQVRDLTLLLGNITILPGERGYRRDIKQFLSELSFGLLFAEKTNRELPPGFLGAAQPHTNEDEDGDDESTSDDESCSPNSQAVEEDRDLSSVEAGSQNLRDKPSPKATGAKDKTGPPEETRGEPLPQHEIPRKFPKSRAEYHLVLIDEMRRVSRHLQDSPSRKYTFQEWAWYLRLIGEDESDASTHRGPAKRPQPVHFGKTSGADVSSQTGDLKWSWVGHRSPLMDLRDEAEWILDKLGQKLRQELLDTFERRKDHEKTWKAAAA